MKRRTFLAASSTVGVAGVASGASVVSSIYSSINTSVLLEEFSVITKNVLDNFMADVKLNIQSLGLSENFAKDLVLPVQIVSKNSSRSNEGIIYKNKCGNYISISVNEDVERIKILDTLG